MSARMASPICALCWRPACKAGCHIAVDSDAHSTHQLKHGLTALYAMLEEMDFPQELIVNATRENLVRELKLHKKPVQKK